MDLNGHVLVHLNGNVLLWRIHLKYLCINITNGSFTRGLPFHRYFIFKVGRFYLTVFKLQSLWERPPKTGRNVVGPPNKTRKYKWLKTQGLSDSSARCVLRYRPTYLNFGLSWCRIIRACSVARWGASGAKFLHRIRLWQQPTSPCIAGIAQSSVMYL